jgi:hypothetical protein
MLVAGFRVTWDSPFFLAFLISFFYLLFLSSTFYLSIPFIPYFRGTSYSPFLNRNLKSAYYRAWTSSRPTIAHEPQIMKHVTALLNWNCYNYAAEPSARYAAPRMGLHINSPFSDSAASCELNLLISNNKTDLFISRNQGLKQDVYFIGI